MLDKSKAPIGTNINSPKYNFNSISDFSLADHQTTNKLNDDFERKYFSFLFFLFFCVVADVVFNTF